MTEAAVSFAGNLTDDPELRHTEESLGRCSGWRCRVAGSRRRRSSPWSCGATRPSMRPSPSRKGSRVVVVGRLQQRSWTAEDSSARSVVEVVAEKLGPGLLWATATTTRTTRSQDRSALLIKWLRVGGRVLKRDAF
jgi:single-strand DNA-binding protein